MKITPAVVFAGYADDNVVEGVVVEVAGCNGETEGIAVLAAAGKVVAALTPELVAVCAEADAGAVENVNEAAAVFFARRADDEIVEGVTVEIAGGERAAELIAVLRAVASRGSWLKPLTPVSVRPFPREP